MRYQGGKSRIAKNISEIINQLLHRERESLTFVSLFCGSCSVESKINADIKICNDKHEYLVSMFNGVQNGYNLPDQISEEEYKRLRNNKDEDKCLSGFVGFGCSFGGKWFGGYARNKTETNYAYQSKKSLLKDMEGLKTAQFTCQDYRDVKIPQDAIVYADPPYNFTTGYQNEKFDTLAFWEYVRKLSQTNIVFISEQSAPLDFVEVWQKPFTRTLDVNKENQFQVVEKLFVHKCNIQYVVKDKNINQGIDIAS
jgi:DNA adenine methylase